MRGDPEPDASVAGGAAFDDEGYPDDYVGDGLDGSDDYVGDGLDGADDWEDDEDEYGDE